MRGGGARQAAAAEDAEQISPQQLDRMSDEQLARMLMLLLEREVRSLLLACRESLCIPAMTLSDAVRGDSQRGCVAHSTPAERNIQQPRTASIRYIQHLMTGRIG